MWTFVTRDPAESPFALCQEAGRGRWARALSFSSGIHLAILLAMAWPSKPIFVKPNLLARGAGGTATLNVTPLYVPLDLQTQVEVQQSKLSLPAVRAQKKRVQKNTISHKRHNVLEADQAKDQVEIGSKQGSALDGPAFGEEVKPALPMDFQEPTIHRSELPIGLQGDVVVEITIDEQGKVVQERLLQGLGHGIDEKVIAAVHDWHFRPATRNGVAIPSKHDVHFHFPS
jgi:TonB family protein